MRGRHGIGWVTLIRFFMGRLEVDHGRRETTMADHGWPLPWSWRAVADHGFLGGNSKDVFTSNIASRQAICNHLFVLAVVTAFQMPSPRRKRTSSAPVVLGPRYTDTSEGRRFAPSLPPERRIRGSGARGSADDESAVAEPVDQQTTTSQPQSSFARRSCSLASQPASQPATPASQPARSCQPASHEGHARLQRDALQHTLD